MVRYFFILITLLFASIKDVQSLEIPNACFVLIMLIAFPYNISNILIFFYVAIVYIVFLLAVSIFDKAMPIGMGDAKLFAALGFSLGKESLLFISTASFLLSGAIAILLVLLRIKSLKDALPFAPFILLACILDFTRIYLLH